MLNNFKNKINVIAIIWIAGALVACGGENKNVTKPLITTVKSVDKETDVSEVDKKEVIWEGTWSRGTSKEYEHEPATLEIKKVSDKKISFTLDAARVLDEESGNVNIGNIKGEVNIVGDTAIFKGEEGAEVRFKLENSQITVETNDEASYYAGAGVVFYGNYVKSTKEQLDDSLKLQNEEIIYSFKTDNGKTVSICTPQKTYDYIVYRYGTKKKVELEYPKDKADSWSKFKYSTYTRPIQGQDLLLTSSSQISFTSDAYKYEIYSENYANEKNESEDAIGIRVTNTSDDNVTTIQGKTDSEKGSLDYLDGKYKLINKVEE
ncbi:MAG TPA: hypothetical protein DEP72_00990 [Clostridiales bacterium]|nr:MAG: hypothetical protein A2Y18_05085 [Clostridiales bacterium GWD2_32_19]HCC06729.1 hypothetical protein [Clostridiales bacterium]